MDRLLTENRLNPTEISNLIAEISNLIAEQAKLSTDRASIYFVLFYSTVNYFNSTSHFDLRTSIFEKYRKACSQSMEE